MIPKRILSQTKQRAVRLVLDHLDEYPNLTLTCETAAQRLEFGAQGLRRLVRHALVDTGGRQGSPRRSRSGCAG